jgi:hypothetical protein
MADRFFVSLAIWRELDTVLGPPGHVWLSPWVNETRGVRRRFMIARVAQ